MHRRLLQEREEAKAVVLVSIDLDELLKLADRIIVLFRGKVAYEATGDRISIEAIAMAMAGTAPDGAQAA